MIVFGPVKGRTGTPYRSRGTNPLPWFMPLARANRRQ